MEHTKEYEGYKEGLNRKNFLQQMEEIPAFMTHTPEGELPPLMEALQSLKYSEDDPDECAENYKVDGNMNFKKKRYKLAVECYDKGLKMKITKPDIRAALLFNRAAANFQLKNYRKCIVDCQDAIKLNPNYTKAIVKGAQACYALEKYSETKEFISRGLALDDTNQVLLDLGQKVDADEKKHRLKLRKQEKEEKSIAALGTAILQRGIRLSPPNPWEEDRLAKTPSGHSVCLSLDNRLIWPVRLLFPEVNQQEFVEQVEESTKMGDILRLILDENPPAWDQSNAYSAITARCFFCDNKQTEVYQIDNSVTLGRVLRDKNYIVENAMPTLFVLSLGTGFANNYLSRFENKSKLTV